MDSSVIVAVIMAIPGIISLVLQVKKDQVSEKVSDADISAKISSAAGGLLDKMQIQITNLEEDQKHLKSQVRQLKIGVNRLVCQIRSLGEEPCWQPKEDAILD